MIRTVNNSLALYSLFAPISKALRSQKLFQKSCSLLANFSLFINLFLPYLSVQPAYAQDATPTPIVETTPAPTPEPTITETPVEPTIEPTATPIVTLEPTIEPTAIPTEDPTITPTVTETPIVTPTDVPTVTPIITDAPTQTPSDNNNQPSDSNSSQSSDNNSSNNSSSSSAPTETPSPTPTILPVVLGANVDGGVIETTVVENTSCRTDLLNPIISSDKADYAPAEIAIITGSGFAVNTDYLLVITAEGQPSQTYNITSDSTGNFTYSYSLYNTYIPNYKVELTTLAGLVLATTTFTDSPTISFSWPEQWITPNTCVSDPIDDENPNNIDLTGSVGSPAVGFASDTNYQFFRERVHGDPGSASNPVEKAWVVLFQISAPQYQFLGSLNGKDDKVQLWENTNPETPGIVDFSPLMNDPAETLRWEGNSVDYARITSAGGGDFYVDWAIPLSELTSRGITTSTTKFFATSADANNYNKDHLKCYEAMSDLSIVKSDSPDPVISGETLTYTLSIHNAGPDNASGVIVTDTLPTGYSVVSVTPSQGSCSDITDPSIQCELGGLANGANATITIIGTIIGSGTVTNNASVTLDTTVSIDTNLSNNNDSEDTTINQPKGTLIVNKIVINDNGGNKNANNFTFSVNGDTPITFIQSTDNLHAQNSLNVNTGNYNITEPAVTGYTTSYNNCSNIAITNGSSATCTITNNDIAPTLRLVKSVDQGPGVPSNFTLTATGDGGFSDTGDSTIFHPVNANTLYTLSESSFQGYSQFNNWQCTGGTLLGNVLTLSPGQDVTCTITNNRDTGSVLVHKQIDLNGDGDWGDTNESSDTFTNNNGFSWTLDGSGKTFGTRIDNLVTTLSSYYHSFTENMPANYHFVSWFNTGESNKSCTNPNGTSLPDRITVLKDQLTEITLCNARNTGTIIVHKIFNSSFDPPATYANSCFTLNPEPLGFQELCADTNGYSTFSNVPSGTYSVDETKTETGWSQESNDCSGLVISNNGDTQNCTVVNRHDTGRLIIQKVVDDASDLSQWSFSLDGRTPVQANINGVVDFGQVITNDTHYITESGPDSYHFVSFTGANCGLNTAPGVGGYTAIVTKNGTTTCTFTNNINKGNMVIKKVMIGGVDTFTFSGDVEGTISSNNGTISSSNVFPNTYTSTESTVTGWDLTDISCDDSNSIIPSTGDLSTKTATINVDPGETVTCTFTNTKRGSLIVHNFEDQNGNGIIDTGDNPPHVSSWQSILYSGSNCSGSSIATKASTYPTPGDGNAIYDNLIPGDYSVKEMPINAAWIMTTPTCQNITVTAGNQSTLNFGKFDLAYILGTKYEDINGNGQKDFGEAGIPNWTINLDKNADGTIDATTTTDINGNYLFNNLTAGLYRIREESVSGWTQTSANPQDITLHSASYVQNIDFGNFKLGKITACKYNDLTGNGQYEASDDQPLSNISIKLSKATNLIDTKETGTNGCVTFEGLTTGTYRVEEDYTDPDLNGYYSTNGIKYHDVSISSGSDETRIFLNTLYKTISGTKFNDLNGDGIKDPGEIGLPNWTIYIDSNSNNQLDLGEKSTTTNTNGYFEFTNLTADSYRIAESMTAGQIDLGWTQTSPSAGHYDVDVHTVLTSSNNDFGNVQLSNLHGYKWDDKNGNGIKDENESYLSGWKIFLDKNDNQSWDEGEQYMLTSSDSEHFGWYWFENLIPGIYSICEVNQNGWTQTSTPTCHTVTLPYETGENTCGQSMLNYIDNGQESAPTCNFGNRLLPPTAKISKFNDASGDLSPGNSVGYKIKVVIFGNDIKDLKVTDLLSNGFTYRPGTYHISVGGSDVTTQVTEPVYHSPGLWDLSTLGNLHVGDTIELSYIADISSDQQSGKYTDLAYAYGQSAYGDNAIVYADGENSQYVNNNFVGTEVPVIKSTQNSISAGVEKREEGQVLGASTELPSTGSDNIWLIISPLMALLGFTFLKKSSKKLIAILFFAAFYFFPSNALAGFNPLSVRLEQPKSPTNINDLKLTFVAMEINGVNPITVKCFKKSPSDGSYSQFGSNISLDAPGNTNQCQTDSSILNSEGTYLFYVTANGLSSNIVSVDYKTSGPGTPGDYRKEWLNGGCDYKIHFRTADDGGKTVKVELYRADITNFILDDGSRVASINIGSNQDYDITNSVPVCDKSYYYVLRAFDDAGNGSGTIGDSVTVTSTTTIGTTSVSGANSGAIPVTGNNIPTISEENAGENTTNNENGQVLGTKNIIPTFLAKNWKLIALFIIIVASIIYVALKKKRTRY